MSDGRTLREQELAESQDREDRRREREAMRDENPGRDMLIQAALAAFAEHLTEFAKPMWATIRKYDERFGSMDVPPEFRGSLTFRFHSPHLTGDTLEYDVEVVQ